MSLNDSNYETVNRNRKKRIKVVKACFSCRTKKIKCDGIQPCMQCKARKKECTFSKDGSINQDQYSTNGGPSSIDQSDLNRLSEIERSSKDIQTHPDYIRQKTKEQDRLFKVSQLLDKLCMVTPSQGITEHWPINTSAFSNTQRQTKITQSERSEKYVNDKLLGLFYRHRYAVFPFLSKSAFYHLIERSDPFITPLLLNSIYCNAAHFSYDECTEALEYFKKAEQLLDSYLDIPCPGTVVALCLMSIFEPGRYDITHHIGRSKSQTYSDIAFRMCFDLKLHEQNNCNTQVTPEEIELKKQVYWLCFCLDKTQGLITSRPVLVMSKYCLVEMPTISIIDDNAKEYEIMNCFLERIKLMKITEQILQIKSPSRSSCIKDNLEYKQSIIHQSQALLMWIRNLPPQFQWTPIDSNHTVPTHPPPNPEVAYLHLLYNLSEIHLLQAWPQSIKRTEFVVSNITQLTCAIAEQLNFIPSFRLVSEAIMIAIRYHLVHCANKKINFARNARFMFQRSLRSLQSITQYRIIDGVEEFIRTLENVILFADEGKKTHYDPGLSGLLPLTLNHTTTCQDDDNVPSITDANSSLNRRDSGDITVPGASMTEFNTNKSGNVNGAQNPVRKVKSYFPVASVGESTQYGPDYFRDSNSLTKPWKPYDIRDSQTTIHLKSSQQPEPEKLSDIYSTMYNIDTMMNNRDTHYTFTSDLMDSSFIDTKQRQNQTEEMTMKSNTFIIDNLYNKEPHKLTSVRCQEKEENDKNSDHILLRNRSEEKNKAAPVYSSGRLGLGIYASAQQHYIDVIRQHHPGLE